jgi:tRNA pseudouridine55 synthase
MTSRRVVDAVMGKVGGRRVGHAGTLDPFAEGLLLVLWGRATGLVPYLHEYSKSYLASIRLGRSTDTQDRTGKILEERDAGWLDAAAIREAMSAFLGDIEQVPPAFSAVKRNGRRSYELARRGEQPVASARTRRVHRFELLEWEPPLARALVVCSTGTYVRTLAHDLGRQLGPGGSLDVLTRIAIGPFRLEDALGVDEVTRMGREEILARAIPPAAALPDWPALIVEDDAARDLANGIPGTLAERAPADRPVRVIDREGRLLALYRGGPKPGFLRVFVGDEA